MSGQSLSELIESIIVDAHGAGEQLTAFLTVFDEEVAVPCAAKKLDIAVEVLGLDVKAISAWRPARWSWPEP